MKNPDVTVIESITELCISDPTFFSGSPYRYELSLREGDYAVTAFGGERAREIRIVNTSADVSGLEWIELAADIFVRSGSIALFTAGIGGKREPVLIPTANKCRAKISCIEADRAVQGVRIEL